MASCPRSSARVLCFSLVCAREKTLRSKPLLSSVRASCQPLQKHPAIAPPFSRAAHAAKRITSKAVAHRFARRCASPSLNLRTLRLQRLVDSLMVQADCVAGICPKTIRYLSHLKVAWTSDNADDPRLHLSAPHGKITDGSRGRCPLASPANGGKKSNALCPFPLPNPTPIPAPACSSQLALRLSACSMACLLGIGGRGVHTQTPRSSAGVCAFLSCKYPP